MSSKRSLLGTAQIWHIDQAPPHAPSACQVISRLMTLPRSAQAAVYLGY